MRLCIAGVAAAALLTSGQVLAQATQQGESGAPPPARSGAPSADLPTGALADGIILAQGAGQLLARDLMGTTVVTQEGKKVGEVRDLMLDPQGQLIGVVITSGSFLGMGGRSVAIAADKVRIEPAPSVGGRDQKMVLIRLTAQEVAEAPEFKSLRDMENTAPPR